MKEINSKQVFKLLKKGKVLGEDILIKCEKYSNFLFLSEYKHVTVYSILGEPLSGFGKLTFFLKENDEE
jgi:hypothetical protein